MTYEELVDYLFEEKIIISPSCYHVAGSFFDNTTNIVTQKWVVGNQTGGGCYINNPVYIYEKSGEDEPENIFDEIVKIIWINIPFIIYKNLIKKLLSYNNFDEREFYGNYTTWNTKSFNLKQLYDELTIIKNNYD